MKDNKKYFINLIIFLTGLILLANPPTFAFDKFRHVITILDMTGPILSPSSDAIALNFIWKAKDTVSSDIGILLLKSDEIKIITKSETDGSLNEFPTWSKDSKHILFRRVKKDGYGLFSINLKTLKEKSLIFKQYDEEDERVGYKEISYFYPIWFPLSDKIVFIKSIFDRDTIRNLGYIYDLKEKKEKEIATGISNFVTFRSTWSVSYDGNYVFYTKKDDKYNDIWLSDLRKGNSEQRLTKGHDVTYLRVSPVKNEILFVAKGKNKSSWTLYKLNLKTRKEEKLLESNNYNLGFPSWSQNGSLIVFVNDKNIINIMDVNKRKITAELKIDMENIFSPILVKNKRIIFYQYYSSIWSVDMEGKNLKKIFPKEG